MRLLHGIKNLAIALIGIGLPLLLLEAAVRFGLFSQAAPPKDRPREFYVAAQAGSSRDYPYTVEKPANTFRIIVIGDSFAFGDRMQFDDTFAKRLERWLNLNRASRRVEVINLSKPGFSSFDEVRLVRAAVTTMSPDLLLLDFTLNDPELRPYRETFKNQPPSVLDQPPLRYWAGLQFIVQRIKVYTSRAHFEDYYNGLYRNPETWDRCANALAEMKTLADGRSIPFAAVIFPLFDHPLDGRYPFFALHKQVQDKFTELGVPWLDLFESYRGKSGARLTVIPGGDSHPNEIAHRIAAEALLRFLREQRLIPAEFIPRAVRQRSIYDPLRINSGIVSPIPTPELIGAQGASEQEERSDHELEDPS